MDSHRGGQLQPNRNQDNDLQDGERAYVLLLTDIWLTRNPTFGCMEQPRIMWSDSPQKRHDESISSSSPSSDSYNSLHGPQKSRQAQASPSKSSTIAIQRISKVIMPKKNILPRPENISIFREEPNPKTQNDANHHHNCC